MESHSDWEDESVYSEFSDLQLASDDDCHGVSCSGEESGVDDDVIDPLRMLSTNLEQKETQLEEQVWESLPEELLHRILTWLPPASLFRFSCVCKRWRALVSSPGWLQLYAAVTPRSCTIMCSLGAREASFFCHSQHRWFDLPLNPVSYLELEWELADADIGLLCYQCNWSGGLWICVCNPLTQSSKVLPPNYPHWDIQPSNCEILKLVVDKQTKTYKVVVLVHSSDPPTTVVFDSTTSNWTVFSSYPSQDYRSESLFVWKHVIYLQCFQPNLLVAFDIDSGEWSEVQTCVPCHVLRRHYLVNHNDRVLLFQRCSVVGEPVSGWKWIEEDSSSSSSAGLSSAFTKGKWVKLTLDASTYMNLMSGDFHSCFSQSGRICFSTSLTNKWISYTFATESWTVMPSSGRSKGAYSWFEWEPRLDIDVEADLAQ